MQKKYICRNQDIQRDINRFDIKKYRTKVFIMRI